MDIWEQFLGHYRLQRTSAKWQSFRYRQCPLAAEWSLSSPILAHESRLDPQLPILADRFVATEIVNAGPIWPNHAALDLLAKVYSPYYNCVGKENGVDS